MKKLGAEIAVSVRFDPETMSAPVISGLAERLRVRDVLSLARRYGIPLAENQMLAAQLCELGEQSEIPEDLYEEIARLLSSVE